jgi:hypothetical protein
LPQTAPQELSQRKSHPNAGRLWGKPFVHGVDGKAQRLEERRQRIETKAKQLAAELGDRRLAGWQWDLLCEVAQELLRRPPSDPVQRTRRLNSIAKLLAQVGLKRRPVRPLTSF